MLRDVPCTLAINLNVHVLPYYPHVSACHSADKIFEGRAGRDEEKSRRQPEADAGYLAREGARRTCSWHFCRISCTVVITYSG